jgi:hypothetical protein
MIMYLEWDPGWLGVVQTMFTDPLNRPINRHTRDHPRVCVVHLLLNSRVNRPLHSTFVLFILVFGVKALGLDFEHF